MTSHLLPRLRGLPHCAPADQPMFEQLVHLFLPPRLRRDDAASRRAQRTVVLSLAILAWAPIFAVLYVSLSAPISASILLVASVVFVATLLSLRIGAPVVVVANLVTGIVLVVLVLLNLVTGGVDAPALRWLPAVPILAIVLCGRYAGWIWVLASCVAGGAFVVLSETAVLLPMELTGFAFKWINYAGDLGFIVCVAVLTWIFKRSEDTTQESLLLAHRAAEGATRAKSAFLANMSHEIRTPINGVLGMTELALGTRLTAEQREYLTMAKSSAKSLLTLIDDVLDFSKIEAGKLHLEQVEFGLRAVLGETLRSMSLPAHEKGLELACRVEANVPDTLVGDPTRLRQIVVNLVSNAVKFTRQGEVVLQVRVGAAEEGATLLHFAVRDTGIGIPPDKQEAIFEAFTQADSSTSRQFGGSGLGLTICAQLVRMMRGRIWVNSQVGKGSVFHFTARFRLGSRQRGVVEPVAAFRRRRVLIVDDNATQRLVLKEMFAAWELQSAAAKDGAAALAALEQALRGEHPFEVVLVDTGLPGMDGFVIAQAVQSHRELSRVRVIMLAAATGSDDAARCQTLGLCFVSKPLHSSDVYNALLEAFGLSGGEIPVLRDDVPAPAPSPTTRGLRILLAEDNFINQKVAENLLEQCGHAVEVAEDGEQAVAMSEREPFDLILMDVHMPKLDGLAAAKAIRRRERGTDEHLPIIALTADAMKGDRERCLAAGMDDYVAKPIHREDLLTAMQLVLAAKTPPSVPALTRSSPDIDVLTLTGDDEAAEPAPFLPKFVGEEAVVVDLVELFLDDCPRRMHEIRDAVSARDPIALAAAARALKGSASILKAQAVVTWARRLERFAGAGDWEQVQGGMQFLEAAVARLLPELLAWRQTHSRTIKSEHAAPG